MNKNPFVKWIVIVLIIIFVGVLTFTVVDFISLNKTLHTQQAELDSIQVEHAALQARISGVESYLEQRANAENAREEEKMKLRIANLLESRKGNEYFFREDIDKRLKQLGFQKGATKPVGNTNNDNYDGYEAEKTVYSRTRGDESINIIAVVYWMDDGVYSYDLMLEFSNDEARQEFIDNLLKQAGMENDGGVIKAGNTDLFIDTKQPLRIHIYDKIFGLPRFI